MWQIESDNISILLAKYLLKNLQIGTKSRIIWLYTITAAVTGPPSFRVLVSDCSRNSGYFTIIWITVASCDVAYKYNRASMLGIFWLYSQSFRLFSSRLDLSHILWRRLQADWSVPGCCVTRHQSVPHAVRIASILSQWQSLLPWSILSEVNPDPTGHTTLLRRWINVVDSSTLRRWINVVDSTSQRRVPSGYTVDSDKYLLYFGQTYYRHKRDVHPMLGRWRVDDV